MANGFSYDHSLLSMSRLYIMGIRSTREIEEVIEGHSYADEIYLKELGYRVIRFIGFTKRIHAIKVACQVHSKDVLLTTFDVRIPTFEEIINDFCRFAIT